MKINFYANLRPTIGQKSILVTLPDNSSIGDLLRTLIDLYPALRRKLLNEEGQLAPHIHIFINGQDAALLPQAAQTILSSTDQVDIFPPIAGGSL